MFTCMHVCLASTCVLLLCSMCAWCVLVRKRVRLSLSLSLSLSVCVCLCVHARACVCIRPMTACVFELCICIMCDVMPRTSKEAHHRLCRHRRFRRSLHLQGLVCPYMCPYMCPYICVLICVLISVSLYVSLYLSFICKVLRVRTHLHIWTHTLTYGHAPTHVERATGESEKGVCVNMRVCACLCVCVSDSVCMKCTHTCRLIG